MSENPVSLTTLNDFIFCPVSIYFHSIDSDDVMLIQTSDQLDGTSVHQKSDLAVYSSKKSILQGISVYSEQYNLYGKIDTFDSEKGILTERKKQIKTIYDGYVFQLYGQYFALKEMGYKVNEIRLYSMDDNLIYGIDLPESDNEMFDKFQKLLKEVNEFSFDGFTQTNISKCQKCIYAPLCSYSLLEGDEKSVYRT